MAKIVIEKDDWHEVYEALEGEVIKTSVYDDFIINLMGDVSGKKVLDYGCGPGIIGKALEKQDAEVDVYDINKRILKIARKRVPEKNIIYDTNSIGKNIYDFVLCNLVLCIVEDGQVSEILHHIFDALKQKGVVFIGFCNPKIFKVRETNLDLRHFTGNRYKDNHGYLKEKKEGGYFILEKHRPIEWYNDTFIKAGFRIEKKLFTSPYIFKGRQIKDFVIFKLTK
ncbi:methyltransferase UbiE [Bacteroidia bacterium]|nr:methyltransferase UbiE [Bacteroidia bacterium]